MAQGTGSDLAVSTLRCQPCLRTRPPAYPTRLAADRDPAILRRHVPAAWLGRRELALATSAFLVAGTGGCERQASTPGNLNAREPAIVAPVFEHGEGRGYPRFTMLGVVAGSYVHLSEEDAVAIVRNELHLAGVQMIDGGRTLQDVIIDGSELRMGHEWIADMGGGSLRQISGPLEADLWLPDYAVAIEYVSYDDFDLLGGTEEDRGCMDIKGVAKSVSRRVGESGRGVYFGALYDPAAYLDWSEEPDPAAAEENKRLLRRQVRDFIEWLKGQGVI